MAFGPTAYQWFFLGHIDGPLFAGSSEQLRVAAFVQAQRELEAAIGEVIPEADSAMTDRVRLDYACYELAMHLIKCSSSPGSGGAVPAYIGASSGDVEAARETPRPHVWPQSVWRWLGGAPSVILSRG